MLSVKIEEGARHWQIFQRKNGHALIHLRGSYTLHPICAGHVIHSLRPMVRVVAEDTNQPAVPWTECTATAEDEAHGRWELELPLAQGGLYRIETALKVRGESPEISRLFGGDQRHHLGVGDLFVIAGQSNAAGFGMDAVPDAPDLRVHLFRNNQTWDLATHPMNESSGADDALNAETGCCGTSPWLSFAKQILRRTGCPVGLIQTAMGGQSIDRWDPAIQGDLLENLISRAQAAGGQAAGILWYQGCSDALPGKAEQYFEQLVRVIKAMRKTLGPLPVFSMQLNRYLKADGNDEAWGLLRESQRRAAHEIPGLCLIPTTDLTLSDYIHNSSASNIALGLRVAQHCAAVLWGDEYPGAPDLRAAVRQENQIRLWFDHCTGPLEMPGETTGARAFRVRFPDGSSPQVLFAAAEPSAPGLVVLKLAQPVPDGAEVSFAWECDPASSGVFDPGTHLPPLSFYRVPVTNQ